MIIKKKENAAKAYESLIPEGFFTFLLKSENGFKPKLSFLDITKILSIYKKINEKTKNKKEKEKRLNIIFSIYFALNSNFKINSKSEEKF